MVVLVRRQVQFEGYFLATGHIGSLGNLVTDTPHDDTGVVAVAAHHKCHVFFMVASEILAVVIGTLGFFPLVEHLVDDEHAEAVASVKESLCGQIVATPNGIVALRFQKLHLAYFSTVYASGSQKSIIMVYTAAIEFGRLAVEQEAFCG